MSTRAVEVAPGVFVAPEGYTGPIRIVAMANKDDTIAGLWMEGVAEPMAVDAPAAEVAAKLWPVEVTP